MPPTAASDTPHFPVRPVTLELDRLRLTIDPAKGAGIVGAWWRRGPLWLPVIGRGVPGEDPTVNHASFIMAPWCNRIRNASFDWHGRRIALKADPRDGTAIHGDVRKRPFELLDRTPVSARFHFDSRLHEGVNFPWPFVLQTRFELNTSGFGQEVTLTSAANEPFPCGVGLHPYFPRRQAPGEHVAARLLAPVGGRFPSERCMPIGPARFDARCRWLSEWRSLPQAAFMDSYTGYKNVCVIDWTSTRLVMTSSLNHAHMVFFAPTNAAGNPEPYFAVEPMTIAADGFNLHARGDRSSGTTVLQPGETLKTWCRFEVHDR